MFICHVCGSKDAEEKLVVQTFRIDGSLILVEKIPAQVCYNCGEVVFSSKTAEKIRILLQHKSQPDKFIQVNVFAYQ
ncbi:MULTISPECIES: type II toxin-antitoxin system MqsA family antitoxin [unclassified Microcystis]|jgi:YgiT-type zinc finger domain-containing protein|uniref:type II toxin-antitoxin system MqsA family antitoxin n=2 Tax=Microcystaceae TaxID=1890449 RepID=UPI001195408B|nr:MULTISPECIES: type II toxin-antitoxin system MqsA family antitoxin [unclassified Microcystis]MCA2926099.1 type II toxin-antitoxin system MqsA family antitoxin [Microcystis sp. M020S1]MCA2934681.1 type II toxin-antitoxin system MqsA family antitoxin [Microcystis sp. M015S1]NCR68383.1 type II toxin-antitoxin system MqsA family antitoxin [Microcystis aeruginosa LL11-07]MCA2620918.1 type II toxin-antitoxin system MqsA family antitoxin [Microcystis sp. M099S2]MCA2651373.1 type II toxin-antitoxin